MCERNLRRHLIVGLLQSLRSLYNFARSAKVIISERIDSAKITAVTAWASGTMTEHQRGPTGFQAQTLQPTQVQPIRSLHQRCYLKVRKRTVLVADAAPCFHCEAVRERLAINAEHRHARSDLKSSKFVNLSE